MGVTALATHAGKNQETLGYSFDTKKFGKFLLKKHRTAILFRRISRFLLAQMLNIPLVSREETPDSSQNLSLMVAPLLRGQGWQWWVGLSLHG